MRRLYDRQNHFTTTFDPSNGLYIRTGILDENGRDTGKEPFMSCFPHLLDIGIMGNCAHGLSGLCSKTFVQCYQDGLGIKSPNMSFVDFKKITDECAGKCFQFALGGRGDPDMHENFAQILEYSRKKGIVPNYTTSGFGLTKEKAKISAEFCGAVAVSWYKTDYTHKAISSFLELGMKVNIHFVLGKNSIDEAIDILENRKVPEGINRIIFLLHKPVGLGSKENVLASGDSKVKYLFGLFNDKQVCDSVGFDSCCVPAVINYSDKLVPESYDACEGGRFSAYITSDMQMLPCSFDQKKRWSVDLRENSIENAWNSEKFESFRNVLRNSCTNCQKREICFGGCPITPEIVICTNKENKEVII